MSAHVAVGSLHHLRLTVTDIERSRQFYTSMLGFQVAVDHRRPATRPTPTRSASCSAA